MGDAWVGNRTADAWTERLFISLVRIAPGADLNGSWYLRNAKIFAKLAQIAKPGDRIVVTFGAGHCYWLRHFVRNTPGFVLVEADDYLR